MSPPISLDLNSSCRLCLSQEGLLPLFSDIGSQEDIFNSLPKRIMACVAIEVSQEGNFPKNICEVCNKSIDDWEKFKEQCDRVNSTLHQFVDSQTSAEYVENLQSGGDTEPAKEQGHEDQSDREAPLSPSSDFELKEPLPRKAKRKRKEDESLSDGPRRKRKEAENLNDGPRKLRTRGRKVEEKSSALIEVVKDNGNSEIDEPNDEDNFFDHFERTESKWKLKYERYQKKKYVCGVNSCDKIFSRFCDLVRHDLSDHADVPLDATCDVCGKVFISDNRLQIHVSTYHGEKKFTCDVCGDRFMTKDSLRAHKRKHSGRFVCQYCGLAANSNMGLIEHIRTHTGEKPFVCDICGQKHSTKNGLNAHKRGHTKEHLFKCNICGYSSANQSSMYMHKATHSNDKPCICETCGKRFKIPVRLAEHKKIHTGIKNFVCEECDMSFLTRYQLTQHGRVHSGEKPFECELCQKKFSRRDNLREHIRTHTREKRYTCERCLQTFSFRKSLNKHSCTPDVSGEVPPYQETINNEVVLYCQL